MSEEGKPARPYWRHIVGWPLLLLGVVGLALPFLQGILFIVVALTLLAPGVPFSALRCLASAAKSATPPCSRRPPR